MYLLPAIDLQGGRVVRLLRGERKACTVYSGTPADMARRWRDEGAEWLHVVDLDAAFDGVSENEPHIAAIIAAVDIPVQVGGGVRTRDKARRLLAVGARRVVLGTQALRDRDFMLELAAAYPQQIVVSVDTRDGFVAARGWVEKTAVRAEDFLSSLANSGIAAAVYTDISRDGALQGPNLQALQQACEISPVPIIASGGIASLDDIFALSHLPLGGIIVGRALYEGALALPEIIAFLAKRAE